MKVRTPVGRTGLAFWSTTLLLALGFAVASSSTVVQTAFMVIGIVAARMAARSLSVGATLTASELVVRGWIRTYRIPLAEVESITVVPYNGLLGGRDVDRSFRMPRIRRRGAKDVYAESLMGTPERVSKLVEVLNERLQQITKAEG